MDVPRVRLDEDPACQPKYYVAVPSAAAVFPAGTDGAASFGSSRPASRSLVGRDASRGSGVSEASGNSSFLIAAVAENRAREIGICAIDLVSPYELLLWTVIDSHSYVDTVSLLQAYQPSEILVVEGSKQHKINDEISKRFAALNCRVVPVARKYFEYVQVRYLLQPWVQTVVVEAELYTSQTKGAEDIKRVMANNVDINIGRNYVAMAAVACVIKYIEYVQGVYIAAKTMKVVISPSTRKLLMDHSTISSLELVQGARCNSTSQSLYKMINNTQTSSGNRLLRSTMLQPTCHLKTIQARHEVIGIFLDNPGCFFDVMEQLEDFVDLDRLLGQLVVVPKAITPQASRIAIGSVIALKHTLECLPELVACLEKTSSQLEKPCALLNSIIQSLRHEDFVSMRTDIERIVNERVKVCRSAAQKRIQECFAIRAGVDGMLDVARRTYLDTIERIHEIVHNYKENLGLPIRLNFTARRGYHLAVPANVKDLPSAFVERVNTKKAVCCSTKALISLNARLNEALTAVYKLSNDVIQTLLDTIRPRASTMHAMVDSVALLDMLLSFTNVVALSSPDQLYTKPNISERGNMIIKKGRHPLVERVLADQNYVPSDTFFDPLSSFHGPNCAGKSTYMRATAIITIMAQMGCYVPAAEAFIPIRDRICTRFGTSDDMEENASSFAVEMTETAFILETCTPKSLVLIDELGRGTANDEGAAIAWGISEELIRRRPYTCFATHYHGLNRLAHVYPRCRCYHMGGTPGNNSARSRYMLKDGPFAARDMYGIKVAAKCGLPAEIIHEAQQTYAKLRSDRDAEERNAAEAPAGDPTAGMNRNLLHHLYALRYAGLDGQGLRRQLQHLRHKFLVPRVETE